MNKTYLFGLMAMAVALAGCSNQPVPVKGDVTVVGAMDTQTTDQNIRFDETNVQGQISAVVPQASQYQSQNAKIPEKATAICNDGTFSMSLLNEACLNNGGVKEAISRYYSE